jgi:ferredoxin--NADP+ reductase
MLARSNGSTKAISTGKKRVLDVDTVVFCIGDKVDETVGLPVKNNEYVRNPDPCCMIEGVSYEVYDPQAGKPIEGMFIAGWSREASSGLVGIARKDGEHGAHSMLKYLEMVQPSGNHAPVFAGLEALLKRSGKKVVSKEDFFRLRAVEQTEASRLGLEDFKFKTNEEMLAAIASA